MALATAFFTLALAGARVHGATTERPSEALRRLLIEAVRASESFEDRFNAEVWLTDMSARLASVVADAHERIQILRHAHHESVRNGLEPELVLAVIQVESNFDRFAISSAGARGLMQIMPFWLQEVGRPDDDLFHIRTNLRIGCTILRYYIEQEGGNLTRALARYNGSVGETWYAQRVYRALRDRWYKQ